MWKMRSQKGNERSEMDLLRRFEVVDRADFPDFHSYEKPLERGLWVLWVSKEKLGIRRLTAEHIASIIRDVQEISIDARSITNSFNRAGDKIHTYVEGKEPHFEIMKPGKDHLLSQLKEGSVDVFYFEPDRRYSSKSVLSKKILDELKGDLRIVDPYCGQRCLDILGDIKGSHVKFLTRVENLGDRQRNRLFRDLRDFKPENPNVEFRNYPHEDLHDRYIIAPDLLVILGHSIKDLGAKESFAIVLNKETSKNIVEALTATFDRRWNQSATL